MCKISTKSTTKCQRLKRDSTHQRRTTSEESDLCCTQVRPTSICRSWYFSQGTVKIFPKEVENSQKSIKIENCPSSTMVMEESNCSTNYPPRKVLSVNPQSIFTKKYFNFNFFLSQSFFVGGIVLRFPQAWVQIIKMEI